MLHLVGIKLSLSCCNHEVVTTTPHMGLSSSVINHQHGHGWGYMAISIVLQVPMMFVIISIIQQRILRVVSIFNNLPAAWQLAAYSFSTYMLITNEREQVNYEITHELLLANVRNAPLNCPCVHTNML